MARPGGATRRRLTLEQQREIGRLYGEAGAPTASIAAKSRRGRTRCSLERSLLCFTGTDVIHQCRMSPPPPVVHVSRVLRNLR
jgi:hypothetical protein